MSRGLPLVGPLERALYLRSLVLFHDLGATELAACAQLTQEHYVRRGEVLYEEWSAPRTLYLLVDGRVRLEKGGRSVGYLKAADDVGLVELLAGQPRGPRAVADTNALALTIDSAALLDLMEDHFSFFLKIRQALGREVARRQREVGSYHTLSAPRTGLPAARGGSSNGRSAASQSSALQSDAGRASARFARASADAGPASARFAGAAADSGGASIDLAEKLLALQRTRLFRDVGLAVLVALTSEDREARLAPGETLWAKDADPAFLALILEGTVACTPEDARHAFRAGSGALLGVDATFGGVPYAYTAVAETPVVAACIDAQMMVDMAEDHFDLAARMLAHCACELLRLQEAEAIEPPRHEGHQGGEEVTPSRTPTSSAASE